MEQENQVKNIIKKIEQFKTSDTVDLSSKEDLAVAIMNLISIEEHLFFTYNKTGKSHYLQLLNETREIRKKYLAQIVKNPEGEIWCISKHLLSSSMRLMEVGTKKLNQGEKEEAETLFDKANVLWNMFWGLNLNILDVKDISQEEKEKEDKEKKPSVFDSLNKVIKKILDCCRE
jgi:hypothetical protein